MEFSEAQPLISEEQNKINSEENQKNLKLNLIPNQKETNENNNIEYDKIKLINNDDDYLGYNSKYQTSDIISEEKRTDSIEKSKSTTNSSSSQNDNNTPPRNDNKFYRYNLIIDDYVFCENNIYLEKGEPKFEYFNNKERYILMDKYVVDRLEKKITLFNGEMDSFTKSISDLGLIKNIDLFKNRDNRLLVVNFINGSNLSIRIDENNNIIEYNNNYVTKIGNDVLKDNKTIRRISLTSVEDIGNDFLLNNNSL